MTSASEALQQAVITALEEIVGMSVYPGPPAHGATPHAVVDSGLESDWSHKSGEGREVRLAVTIRDKAQRPGRTHRLAAEAQAALARLPGAIGASTGQGWRLVTMQLGRSRVVADGEGGWAAVIEYRARMLAA